MRNVTERLSLNSAGFSLIQLMVGVGLATIVSVAVINMMGFSNQEQKRAQFRNDLLKLKNSFSEVLHQDQSILNTIAATANTNMACLRNRTACAASLVASGYSPTLDRIAIYNSGPNGGQIFYDGRASSSAGFTEKGTKCTGFSAAGAGNDACPIGYITNWYVNQTSSDQGLTLTITAKLVFNPSDTHPLKTFVNATGSDTRVGQYDVIVSKRVLSLSNLSVVSCSEGGVTLHHSAGYVFYATSSVPLGSRCQQETRVCSVVNNTPSLSGNYTNSTCVQNCSGAWGPCSVACGGGTQTYTVDVPANQWGAACPHAAGETRTCNTAACAPPAVPVNCVGAWGPCTAGSQTFIVTTPASGGGTACTHANGATQSCAATPSTDCVGSWGAWSTCSKPCGSGTQARTFTITTPAANGGAACSATNGQTESQACNTHACPEVPCFPMTACTGMAHIGDSETCSWGAAYVGQCPFPSHYQSGPIRGSGGPSGMGTQYWDCYPCGPGSDGSNCYTNPSCH
ncbi:thrombospondin type-1 domain-containing protein [Pseudobdellovibrio exovorus]|uniref:Spondin-like TSP1 domain-containing protein n=1 Tax=Pseudobdellovibrio exovorus JSS TaxID=1184267 RepID=M4V509_9BACT|nr:thrombospondin type-1 domain-containing protein [Pseudobdellovibrio exovorus]AGH94268.1 hypothetical protein A11Q_48 [Pseudobdellovibrio exovorus JSS]